MAQGAEAESAESAESAAAVAVVPSCAGGSCAGGWYQRVPFVVSARHRCLHRRSRFRLGQPPPRHPHPHRRPHRHHPAFVVAAALAHATSCSGFAAAPSWTPMDSRSPRRRLLAECHRLVQSGSAQPVGARRSRAEVRSATRSMISEWHDQLRSTQRKLVGSVQAFTMFVLCDWWLAGAGLGPTIVCYRNNYT